MARSALNPSALEWVPSQRSLDALGRSATQSLPSCGVPDGEPQTALDQAPKEVLASILSRIDATEDLCSCMATCRALRDAARDAPVAVRISPAQRRSLGDPSKQPMLRLLTDWAIKHCKSAVTVDASGLPLEDAELGRLLSQLRRLAWLDLEGCRKLTPAATRLLLSPDGSGGSSAAVGAAGGVTTAGALPHLRWANLQRCFQLKGCCFDDLLALSRLPGSALEGIAVSHLSLEGGACRAGASGPCGPLVGAACCCASPPATAAGTDPVAAPAPVPLRASSLRMVVLTNCVVTPAALLALARAAPDLEYLFLGGSLVRTDAPPPPAASAPAAAVPAGQVVAGQGPAPAGDGDAAQQAVGPEAVAAAGAATGGGGAHAETSVEDPAFEWLRRVEQRLGLPADLPPEAWGEAQPPGAPRAAAAARARGLALAAVVLALPRLLVLEATFVDAAALRWLDLALTLHAAQLRRRAPAASAAAAPELPSSQPPSVPQVWDLCRPHCVQAAVRELTAERCRAEHQDCTTVGALAPRQLPLAAALRAAVNCSSAGRLTALHVAAEAGCAATVRSLVFDLGASVSGRDSHGQQPLFLACEAGHAAAAAALLRAGACATANTTSGESPLYIASLKGHHTVVRLLLRHLVGVPWHHSSLYGDGFTPLMAAAVANRIDVATLLLQEAGAYARSLALATNRYGQSALQIAARKGCTQMMQLLATAAA